MGIGIVPVVADRVGGGPAGHVTGWGVCAELFELLGLGCQVARRELTAGGAELVTFSEELLDRPEEGVFCGLGNST